MLSEGHWKVPHHLLPLADALDRAVFEATTAHRIMDEENTHSIECHLCHEWDRHMEDCPVPALQRWLETGRYRV